jgi:hypothetical protein
MKKLYFVYTLLSVLILLSCPSDNNKNNDDDDDDGPLTLDQRLIGGKWYYVSPWTIKKPYDSNRYIEFTTDKSGSSELRLEGMFFADGSTGSNCTIDSVYSIDGVIYGTNAEYPDLDGKCMQYEFIDNISVLSRIGASFDYIETIWLQYLIDNNRAISYRLLLPSGTVYDIKKEWLYTGVDFEEMGETPIKRYDSYKYFLLRLDD